jgi:hypothetical protein
MAQAVDPSRRVPDWRLPLAVMCLAALVGLCAHADETQPVTQTAAAGQLDLRLGDLSRIVRREELDTPLPDQLDDVTIWGHPETPDMVETRPVPGGLAGIFWAAWHPTQLWRLFVPDPNLRMPEDDREP